MKRQIDSGYFTRSGLSRDKEALRELANQGAVQQSLTETVKLPSQEEMERWLQKELQELR